MGNLISLFRSMGDKTINEIDDKFNLFIDFEKETIENEGEARVHELSKQVDDKIKESSELLICLSDYGPGGSKVIQEAISKPSDPQIQDEAWDRMVPLITNLINLKESYTHLNQMIPEILGQLWAHKTGRESSALLEVFKQRESLLIQLGKILDVDMKFDALKMSVPSIPNDISYVKRQATVRKRGNQAMTIEPEQLEQLSMFYITTNPAMTSCINTITQFFQAEDSKSEPLDLIVVFCKVCMKVLDTNSRANFKNAETVMMVHRVMVATALLYDHLSTDGVFVKESPIKINIVVELLEDEGGMKRRRTRSRISPSTSPPSGKGTVKKQPSGEIAPSVEIVEQARVLLNVLKYSNKNLNKPTTPKATKDMFNRINV